MKNLKNWSQFNENIEQDGGKLILTVDDDETTWYYFEDAIHYLLDTHLHLTPELVNDIAVEEFPYQGIETFGDLTLDIERDFEYTLHRIFIYLIENNLLDKELMVKIKGIDDTGKEYDETFIPKEK